MTRSEFTSILQNESNLQDIDIVNGDQYSTTEIKVGLEHLSIITRGTTPFKFTVNEFLFTELCRGRYWHNEKPIVPEIQTYWNRELQSAHETKEGSNVILYRNIFQSSVINPGRPELSYSLKRLRTTQSIINTCRTLLGQYKMRRCH